MQVLTSVYALGAWQPSHRNIEGNSSWQWQRLEDEGKAFWHP